MKGLALEEEHHQLAGQCGEVNHLLCQQRHSLPHPPSLCLGVPQLVGVQVALEGHDPHEQQFEEAPPDEVSAHALQEAPHTVRRHLPRIRVCLAAKHCHKPCEHLLMVLPVALVADLGHARLGGVKLDEGGDDGDGFLVVVGVVHHEGHQEQQRAHVRVGLRIDPRQVRRLPFLADDRLGEGVERSLARLWGKEQLDQLQVHPPEDVPVDVRHHPRLGHHAEQLLHRVLPGVGGLQRGEDRVEGALERHRVVEEVLPHELHKEVQQVGGLLGDFVVAVAVALNQVAQVHQQPRAALRILRRQPRDQPLRQPVVLGHHVEQFEGEDARLRLLQAWPVVQRAEQRVVHL
mmetsp:Transcript_15084/g.32416  ORF Transcript_15084/g.32416 Transcript_15084/m.32416 type:complete len:347 (-) Transcript_15084:2011-3051(-)